MLMEEKKDNKLFLPFLISVVITILLFYFSMLFVEDYRETINYIFIGLIYIYMYLNLYKLFNNLYISFLDKYTNVLKKIKIIKNDNKENINNNLLKKDKKYRLKLKSVYSLIMIFVISLLLFIWQMIVKVSFLDITSIICLLVAVLSLILSVFILKLTIDMKVKKKKITKKQ